MRLATGTRRLPEDRVAATLLRLAAPTVLVMVIQVVVSPGEAVLVGCLGAEALAGVSLNKHPDVLGIGTTYQQLAGPAYGFISLGLAQYFASQGAGRSCGRSWRDSPGC